MTHLPYRVIPTLKTASLFTHRRQSQADILCTGGRFLQTSATSGQEHAPDAIRDRSVAIRQPVRYAINMRSNTKSSITLPIAELRLVRTLKARLRLTTNVEVVRRGLRLLAETTERKTLKDAYREASNAARRGSRREMAALDALADEGIE